MAETPEELYERARGALRMPPVDERENLHTVAHALAADGGNAHV
jgi:hypothetical protein